MIVHATMISDPYGVICATETSKIVIISAFLNLTQRYHGNHRPKWVIN